MTFSNFRRGESSAMGSCWKTSSAAPEMIWIKNKGVTNLCNIINQNYENIDDIILKNFTKNLENLDV